METFNLYPDIGLIGHRLIRIDARGNPIGMLPSKETMPQGRLSDRIFQQNSVAGVPTTSGLALTREIAEVAFPLDPAINRDVDEVIRRVALSIAPMRSIEYPLGMYRTHETNDSVSALDLSRIDSTIDLYRSINVHHRKCLMRVDSSLADRVVPVDTDPDVTTLEFVRARLRGQYSREFKARVRNAIRDGRIREGRKLFWWIMSAVPMPLFHFGLFLFKSQGGVKVRIDNALRPFKKILAALRS